MLTLINRPCGVAGKLENQTAIQRKPREGHKPRYITSVGATQYINKAMRALEDITQRMDDYEVDMQVNIAVFALRYEQGKSMTQIVYLLKRWKQIDNGKGQMISDSRYWRTTKQVRRILEHPFLELPTDG